MPSNVPPFRLPAPVDVRALLAEPIPERQWVIPGLFEHGDRCIITGGEGEGKSALCRQMAIQLALGIHPLTLESCEPQRVFLADGENSREQIKAEIQKICLQADVMPPPAGMMTVGNWDAGLNLIDPKWEAALQYELEESRPDILFIGPLYKLAEGTLSDEGVSRSVAAALDRIRTSLGLVIVIEAHQINEQVAFDTKTKAFRRNREARPFGSSLWRRWPEFGRCLFHDGTLFAWRKDRQSRDWPDKLRRGDSWLWVADNRLCLVCDGPLTGQQERFCSEKCKNVKNQRDHRQRAQTTDSLPAEIGD